MNTKGLNYYWFMFTLKRYWLNVVSCGLCLVSCIVGIFDIVFEIINHNVGSILYDIFWILVTVALAVANFIVFKNRYKTYSRLVD